MIKSEILKGHVLTAAKGLSTSDLNEVIESLSKIEKDRLKEVLGSVTSLDWSLLLEAYDVLCEFESVIIEKTVSCRIMICGDNVDDGGDSPYFLTSIKGRDGHYSDSFDVDDHLFTDSVLLEDKQVKTKYEKCQEHMKRFHVVLQKVADKYRIDPEILIMRMEDYR